MSQADGMKLVLHSHKIECPGQMVRSRLYGFYISIEEKKITLFTQTLLKIARVFLKFLMRLSFGHHDSKSTQQGTNGDGREE